MTPASSRSKSKDKKAGKEAQPPSLKPSSAPANAGSGIPASAYNPVLGTFHTLELPPTSSVSPLHSNSRFRNIDETDDNSGGSVAAGAEYDSVSNNGSWSGESEDHKDKTSNPPTRQEAVPGADNDKREKIRQKNERKHQRQKERRAQELHEKCSGYLMSRKLEALAQQLVAMGFSQERATMALILNEGRVEESVAWLFEGGEDADQPRDQNLGGGNLKIDISEELARISDLETRFKCSKQEVERAIVACEGDLQKAAESLRASKQDPPSISLKPEETGDPPNGTNGKLPVTVSQNMRPHLKLNPPTIQQRRDDKVFNYTKPVTAAEGSLEPASKSLQTMKKGQPKLEWAKPQPTPVPAERRWSNAGSIPSVSYSLSSLQVSSPPVKTETRYVAAGVELKNLHPGTVREPVIMMQRPQSVNSKQVPASTLSSSPPGSATSWYPSTGVEMMRSFLPHIPSNRSPSPSHLNSNQICHQFQYQQQQQQQFVPGSIPADSPGANQGSNMWSRAGASPTLAAASSLGLFSGLGSAGSSGAASPADWNAGGGGSCGQIDYTSIDWSLDRGLSSSRPTNGMWTLPSIMKSNTNFYDPKSIGLGVQPGMRTVPSNMNGVSFVGLQDGAANVEASAASSREWTSPFEGEDLFSLPRQFVSSSL